MYTNNSSLLAYNHLALPQINSVQYHFLLPINPGLSQRDYPFQKKKHRQSHSSVFGMYPKLNHNEKPRRPHSENISIAFKSFPARFRSKKL